MDTPDHKRYSSLCKGHAPVLLLYHRQQWYSFKQKSPDWQMLLGVSVVAKVIIYTAQLMKDFFQGRLRGCCCWWSLSLLEQQ